MACNGTALLYFTLLFGKQAKNRASIYASRILRHIMEEINRTENHVDSHSLREGKQDVNYNVAEINSFLSRL
jgi:hypothetical protein